ncbi:MAG: 2,3-bisphosphoglycerate-independent phosphoglycerate mutase [Candidatus Nealsonbacteria bacterium]|nr:2,3-bisphosphoglycerate-independent phosphoglycerate mutase [Candidatus Nealsonbacteria bacterium]
MKSNNKVLFLIIDGLGDSAIPEFNGKTPLESANTPNLDQLAKNGACGSVNAFLMPPFKLPDSSLSHFAAFGYDPKKYFPGRGICEALGVNFKLKEGDVALRVNFGTVDENLIIVDRRAGRIADTSELVKAISGIKIDGVSFIVKDSMSHRAVLVLRGTNISDKITDNDKKKMGIKPLRIKPRDKSREAIFTAKVLNEFLEKAHEILKVHPLNKKRKLPANYLLVRGVGKMKVIPSFEEKHGMKAVCIAGGDLYKGIARALGMKVLSVKGSNIFFDTNLKGEINSSVRSLKDNDFVFWHIKATDSLAEDGNFIKKRLFIERIDREIFPLMNLKNTLLVITSDHSTCSLKKSHCKKLIPTIISGPKVKADSVSSYSEKSCLRGSLGKMEQLNLMKKVKSFL